MMPTASASLLIKSLFVDWLSPRRMVCWASFSRTLHPSPGDVHTRRSSVYPEGKRGITYGARQIALIRRVLQNRS